ncbi:radical SAM protein [Candidatus Daviesbacteria bacterium]|nr:radical SAM protein [Candidatus Daviesbacteria bacterium]
MRLESDIGAAGEDVYPEQFARPYRPLSEEFLLALKLARPRYGHSPRLASIKVTDKCNFSCPHCNANQIGGQEMTTAEIYNAQRHLKKIGTQRLDITGGEPTLRGDLTQIISHGHELDMLVTLNTNGGIKKEKIMDEYAYWYDLAEAGLFGAYFSFDGMGQKTDPRVIHLAAFLVNTLHIFGGVRTVVTQDNLDKVYDIGRRCMLNNVFFQAVPAIGLNGPSSASPDNFHPLDAEGRQEFIKIIRELSKVRGPMANFLHVPNSYLKSVVDSPDSNSAWHCKRPSAHWIFVDAQGNARVCNDRLLPQNYSLKGEDYPFTKEFHKAVERESKRCGGCSWFCNWEGNRKQTIRGGTDLRFYITINSLT